MSDSECSQRFCRSPQTHHSATTADFIGDELKYEGYCEKHAKIRWINFGYHMMRIGK